MTARLAAALALLLSPLSPVAAAGATPAVVARETDGADPAVVAALVRELDAAARRYAPRVPVGLDAPIVLVFERDYPSMAKRLGEIGETVRDGGGALHLVADGPPSAVELDAFRFGLARALVDRAGIAAGRPQLADGGAAWLVGRFQGREIAEWPRILAATGTWPTLEELFAGGQAGDRSEVLSVAAAAAVLARSPGADLATKVAAASSAKGEGPALPAAPSLDDGRGAAAPAPPGRRSGDGGPPALEARRPLPPFLRGVSFAMLNGVDVGYHAPSVDGELARLAALGADAVSLMPFAYQPAADRPAMRFLSRHPASETDVGLLHAARRARARGMRVLWKPHLWVGHGSWPGDVAMTDEASWAAWFRTYRRYVVHHAVLAERAGAELFSIGVELGKTVDRREWLELIAAVRRVYGGAVVYSGNWWGDFDRVPFWDRLDAIGVDAYFPLAGADAGPEEVREGARRVALLLGEAARRFGKPVILTEVGFAARAGAWSEPHQEGGPLSLADQRLAFDAFFAALEPRPSWLAGVFVWKAFSADGADARSEADFRFLGRPAEEVVRRFFAGSASARAGALGRPFTRSQPASAAVASSFLRRSL